MNGVLRCRPALVTRVAAVDLGTNSTRLLVADVDGETVDELVRRTTRSRASAKASTSAAASSPCRSRACATARRLPARAEGLGAERALAIATSAVRDAENGEAFLGEIEWSYGFTTRLAHRRRGGAADASAASRGATLERRHARPRHRRRLDGARRRRLDGVRCHDSLDVGSVRLTERFLHGDPPAREELERCAGPCATLAAVPDALAARRARRSASPARSRRSPRSISGSPTYDRDRVHGHRSRARSVAAQLERLAALPARGAARDRRPRAGARAGDRRRRCDPLARRSRSSASTRSRSASATSSTAPRSRRPSCPSPEEGAAPPGAYTCC